MPVVDSNIGEGTIIHQPELVNIYGARIGKRCRIGAFVEIGPAIIGDDCSIQARAFIPKGITIASDTFIGPGVIFCNDKYPPSHGEGRQGTYVGFNVSIGAGAIILPGVTIGADARIAAGAIITKDVGAGELSYGANRKG
jgi:acetyltransferase-like isoleucine patch superfamily enzyme